MTILGKHTVAEIRDLLNAYNYQYDSLSRAFDGAKSQWLSQEPTTATQWKNDFDAWNSDVWQPARTKANTVLNSTVTTMQTLTTDETTYQMLAASFLPLTDFDRRFRASSVRVAAPKYENNPQPQAPDADLGAYKNVDAGTQAMPDAVKKFIATVAPGLVPKTADEPNYKPVSKTTWVLLGAGVAVVLGIALKR
jgi:hypothetical protein